MNWDNGEERLIDTPGDTKGLFLENYTDGSIEGWYCVKDETAMYGWSCYSAKIEAEYFDPEDTIFPTHRHENSWWECGCEDKKTYTQASCRELMVFEGEAKLYDRVRYDPETNLIFWGLSITNGEAMWVRGGERSLAGGSSLVTAAAVMALALLQSVF